MSRSTRIFLIVLIGGILAVTATVGAAVAAVYRSGTVAVDFQEEDGSRIRVGVPAALVRIAIHFVPDSLLEEAAAEARPFVPAVRAGWSELRRAPDFVLAEIDTGSEEIRIEKRSRRFRVRVDSPDVKLAVELPMRTVGALVSKLEAI